MLLEQFKRKGYASVELNPTQALTLKHLYTRTMTFSRLPVHIKGLFQTPQLNMGYRPLGAAHAGDPDQVDFNDSFLYWYPGLMSTVPSSGQLLMSGLEAYRITVCIPVMTQLVNELHDRYKYRWPLSFERTSVLQFNSFHVPTDRELLQTRHEDGVVATVIWTSAPGLEAFWDGRVVSLNPGPTEVLVMPGGILEIMSGGEFPALYHQARNLRMVKTPRVYDPERKSIMYFSSFDPTDVTMEPFVRNERNQNVDIGELIRSSPDMFGIPAGFYPS